MSIFIFIIFVSSVPFLSVRLVLSPPPPSLPPRRHRGLLTLSPPSSLPPSPCFSYRRQVVIGSNENSQSDSHPAATSVCSEKVRQQRGPREDDHIHLCRLTLSAAAIEKKEDKLSGHGNKQKLLYKRHCKRFTTRSKQIRGSKERLYNVTVHNVRIFCFVCCVGDLRLCRSSPFFVG